MNKNNRIQKYTLHFAAFALPATILIAVFITLGFYPFGNKTLLIMDMNDQYVHFFASLKDMISGQSSLFFSWSKAMGQNYIGLFAYYLASPLSFITLFFKNEALPLGILILTVLKISLCGLTFSVYLDKVFDENRTFKLFFTTCYALMSYNLVYSLSLMWLDAVIYLPIILLGIEYIIRGKKPVIFIFSIALMFLSNYYISYAVSIFCVIYYFFRWFSLNQIKNGKALVKNLCITALSAVSGIGLSAWLLIPTVFDLSIKGAGWNNTNTFNYSFWEIIKKLTPCYYDSITNSGLPAIFCGVGILILAIAFFFNQKIQPKVKVMTGGVFIIFLLSFWIVPIDKFWHGMQTPNWFPYRYAFLFSFFLIFTAYHQFANMKFTLKPYLKEIVSVGLIGLVCLNLYFNSSVMIKGLDQQFGYKSILQYEDFYTHTNNILKEIHDNSGEMFRIEKDYEYSKNDAMLFGFNGITHYSSTHNKQINNLTKELGFTQSHFWNSYFGSTPVTDSIFNVKYIFSKKEKSKLDTAVKSKEGITLYRNDYCLPIGFAIQKRQQSKYQATTNPFENQNNLLNTLSGAEKNVFQPLQYQSSFSLDRTEAVYHFTALNDEPVYLFMNGGGTYANVSVNGNYIAPYFSSETRGILYIGTFNSGEKIEIKVSSNNSNALEIYDTYLYYIDSECFSLNIDTLCKESFQETKQLSNGLNAKITTDDSKMCFTSIPYAKGFTVKINGKAVENFAYADTFLAFQLPKGESTIEIRFVSPGFYLGLTVSLITLGALLILCFREIYYHKNSRKF